MYIAICDDNVADRKQMERLLNRESSKRTSTTGTLYVESYGNAKSLLANPIEYDAYYIDMCKTEGYSGMDLVNDLLKKGVHSPIFMCCSEVNYREQPFPEQVSFIDKPIRAAELSESIDSALEAKKQTPAMIELREDTRTLYVTEPEIIYGIEHEFYVDFTLTEGRSARVATSALNFFSQVEVHPQFLAPSEKAVLNCRYISRLGFRSVIMTDGTKFKVHKDCMPYAKKMFVELNSQS